MHEAARKRLRLTLSVVLAMLPRWAWHDFWRGCEPQHERAQPVADGTDPKVFVVDSTGLPEGFPTHMHSAAFWEALGRAVATFGFLEETLAKAIFAFTGTRRLTPAEQSEEAIQKWIFTLQKALSRDTLGSLISEFEKAVHGNPDATIADLDDLVSRLRKASSVRNVLCHGSWNRRPDAQGRSVPFFVNRELMIFDTLVDVAFLQQVQRHTAELACEVVSTVTQMGWQFPGSNSPGNPIV